jgi:hypothetical protein
MKVYCNRNDNQIDKFLGKDVWVLVSITNEFVTDRGFYCKFIDMHDGGYSALRVSSDFLDDSSIIDYFSESEWAKLEKSVWGEPDMLRGTIDIVRPFELLNTEEIAELASRNIPSWDASEIIRYVESVG